MRKAPAIFLFVALTSFTARAGDLVTLSGVTYRDVRVVSVDPDGVIWQHAEGVCKVDFEDSPPAIRQSFHYDPARAAAFRAEEARQQQEARQLLAANEQRQLARGQAAAAANTASVSERETTFRRAASPAASEATRALAGQFAAEDAKKAAAAANLEGVLGAPGIWSIVPRVSGYRPSRSFEVSNADEYKASLHRSPTDGSVDSFHDSFLTPVYMTRSYDEDVDRAAAFARGVPLRPPSE